MSERAYGQMTSNNFTIVGAAALAGADLRPIENAVVVVENGQIGVIGAAGNVAFPEGAEEVDASGLTLLPGFIDAHVHIGFAEPAAVLRGGVTTVRDLAWPRQSIWPLARESAADSFDGPLILAAGQMLTVDGGYPTRAPWAPPGTGRVVRGPDDAEDAVAEQADAGAAVIKVALNAEVGRTLDEPTLTAIVDAAHGRGLNVTGHVYGLDELNKALSAGLDELAHMLMSPDRIPDHVIAEMVTKVVIVPTLSIFFGEGQDIAVDNLRHFLSAGGRVVYGTDLGNAGPQPGIDPREIQALARAGMSGRAIIASATVESAKWLRLGNTGKLAAGMTADMVAVEGNPLADPQALTQVRMAWRAGRRAR